MSNAEVRPTSPPPPYPVLTGDRVRCDLKDLPIATAGPNPACSNCKERGLKCVYVLPTFRAGFSVDVSTETSSPTSRPLSSFDAVVVYSRSSELCSFATRHYLIAYFRAIYGKATDSQNGSSHFASPATHLPSIIPQLKPEFFSSSFWRWFSVQRKVCHSTGLLRH